MASTIQDRSRGVIGDFAYKAPCRVVATTPIVTSGTQTIDGVALAVLDRVLVTGQADTTLNGIYTVDTGAWELAPDFLSSQSVARGSQVFITDGTTNQHTIWYIVASNPVNPQTPSSPSAITITKLSTGGSTTLTGDVTGSGTGSIATTIAAGAVANSKLANVSTATFKGRTTAGTGSPEDLTVTQATALLNVVVGDSGSGGTKGLMPAAPAGAAAAGKYADAAGGFSVPSAGAGGGLVFVEGHVASSSASLDFTTGITGTYDTYMLVVSGIVPDTTATELLLRFSTDGGATFSATGYGWSLVQMFNDSVLLFNGQASDSATGISLFGTNPQMNTNTGAAYSANLTINNLLSASAYKTAAGTCGGMASNGVSAVGTIGGIWKTGTAVNALRLIASSGNLASGVGRLYGLAKS